MAKTSKANHERAPQCAEFVKHMREVFGDVKVLYVKEGDFEIGKRVELGNPATAGVVNVSLSGRGEAKGADARGHAAKAGEVA